MRKSEREYMGDVVYETWRNGGDPDMVDPERVRECRGRGCEPDEAAAEMMRRRGY